MKLSMDNFRRQSNELVWLSTEELYEFVAPPPHFLSPQLPLACQFTYSWYDTVAASHSLYMCELTCWNPPDSSAIGSEPIALSKSCHGLRSIGRKPQPINSSLRSHLPKADPNVIKMHRDFYLSPESPPKPKTVKHSAAAEWFRFHSLSLGRAEDRW